MQITFTANLSKAQLILQTVVAKLDEATKDRNLRLFSDALEMISCLEVFLFYHDIMIQCYDCIKLYECFQKSSPLLVILIFYGNISLSCSSYSPLFLVRISSFKVLFLVSKQQVIIPNLEKVLFCDTPEIPSILKDYQMKYNSTTKAISHDSKATFNNTIKHYERPVSFIQTKIKYFLHSFILHIIVHSHQKILYLEHQLSIHSISRHLRYLLLQLFLNHQHLMLLLSMILVIVLLYLLILLKEWKQ